MIFAIGVKNREGDKAAAANSMGGASGAGTPGEDTTILSTNQ